VRRHISDKGRTLPQRHIVEIKVSLEHSPARDRPRRFIRPRQAWERLSISRSQFYVKFVHTGRIQLFPLGARAKGVLESEIEAVIDEIIAGDNAPAPSQPLNDYRERQRTPARRTTRSARGRS
jgi:predicted DNA-binding transcriptional regulator AlpA